MDVLDLGFGYKIFSFEGSHEHEIYKILLFNVLFLLLLSA